MEKKMEDVIIEVLAGDAQKNALEFASYLRENEFLFERGKGYWEDKFYWMIKLRDEYVCFVLINGYGSVGNTTEPEGWIIWFDNSGPNWFEDFPLDDRMKEIAWKNVDVCGNCGSCGSPGGTRKTIFGKEFDNVCITAIRFDNPDAEEVECAKKMVEIRKNGVWVE